MNNKSYPKSIRGLNCIGPCFPPNTSIIHPVFLINSTKEEFPICPIKLTKVFSNGKEKNIQFDECEEPTSTKYNKDALIMNALNPGVDFNDTYFIKLFYKIYSFEAAINWYNQNNFKNIYTLLRVLNSTWIAYGMNLTNISHETINIYKNISKKYWIKNIYKNIFKYIYIGDNKIYTNENKNNDKLNYYQTEKINFIVKNFLNHNSINIVLSNHLKMYKKEWKDIEDHHQIILLNLIKFIKKKIKNN